MRGTNRALTFNHHKNMVIVLVVVHVILNVGLTIDHPEISQIGAPETERAAVVYRRSDGYVGLIDS